VRKWEIDPERFRLGIEDVGELQGGEPAANAERLERILGSGNGSADPAGLAAVLLNAGAAIYVAGIASSLAEGIAGLAKWSPPERRAPRSIGSGKRPLVFPDDADHDALDDYIALVDAQRLHRVIGRLQSDPATWLAIVTFDRGALAVDQRDDRLSGFGWFRS